MSTVTAARQRVANAHATWIDVWGRCPVGAGAGSREEAALVAARRALTAAHLAEDVPA